jgi:hypothetical protein
MDYIGSRSFRSASGVAGKLQGALLSLAGIVSMAAGTALAQPATLGHRPVLRARRSMWATPPERLTLPEARR